MYRSLIEFNDIRRDKPRVNALPRRDTPVSPRPAPCSAKFTADSYLRLKKGLEMNKNLPAYTNIFYQIRSFLYFCIGIMAKLITQIFIIVFVYFA